MKFKNIMKKIVGWFDAKFERFREEKPVEEFVPKTQLELIEVLKRTPKNVLSSQEKNIIASIMNLENRRVSDLMIEKDDMIFVKDDEMLGPLNLDKLYKSGYSIFPVIDKNEKIIGIIKTASLNSLEIKEAKKAKKFLEKDKIIFLKESDSIKKVIDEFLKSNSLFFVVKNKDDEITGMLTFDIVVYYLLGKI
ncbi:CBS domain-containing protein [Candidatus Saccharibacteria bacterium]|nr:CBS domain-containing protein [Candidatus Saccharibacteria bacterium]